MARAYLAAMTSRLLLTLLALLTGLAAQASPAEARMQSARAAQTSAVAARVGEARKSVPAGLAQLPDGIGRGKQAIERHQPFQTVAPAVSAVLVGIDRARE